MVGIYFKETQRFNLSWKWMLFIAIYALMFWALIQQFAEVVDLTAIITISLSLCLIIFFNIVIVIMKLETLIDENKVTYQFKPFHNKPREIKWDEISEFFIRDYKPVKEYGGYGIQRRIKAGRAFTVSGKKGLQLILKDGKKILIGTHKPKELEMLIDKLKSRTN